MKKLIALMLSGILIASLAAFGSGSAAPTAAPSQDSPAAAAPEEKIVITVLDSGSAQENDFETETLPRLISAKYPNVTVEASKLPDDQYYTALKTKIASGEAPDMFRVAPKGAGSNSVITLAEAGYLAPINELGIVELAGASGTDAFRVGSNVYTVSSGVSILGTYVNMDMLKSLSLSIPTTWAEFLDVCQKLKDGGIQPIVMGDKDMYVMQFGMYQLAASKVYPKNPAYDDQLRTGETHFTDTGSWDTVLEMYDTLYKNGYIDSSSLGISQQQSQQMFVDKQAAMTFDGSWSAPTLRGADFELGYYPLPGNEGSEILCASMAPGSNWAIYSGSKHIDACKNLLQYWFDGESDLWKAYVDADKAVVTYGYGSDRVDVLFQPFMELYNNDRAYYWCNQGWPAGVENEMLAKFSELIGGQNTTVPEITKAMQRKFEEMVAG
jgi:raffinose/stachyose/melibiose transport system substrate-binding protein